MNKYLLAFAPLVLSVLTSNVARAEEPASAADASSNAQADTSTATNPFSMALLAGHGFKDGFGTGFGGRLGYTLSNKFYVGAAALYHLGTKTDLIEADVWYAGGEVGYDLSAGPLVIRPYAGVGAAGTTATVTLPPMGTFAGGKTSASDTRLAFWPGASLLLPFEDGAAFVGLDAKMVVVEDASAFNMYGTFGLAL